MGKKSRSGSCIRMKMKMKIRDEDPGSYCISKSLKIPVLKLFMRIRNLFDSGMEKFGSGINIPDPQHWWEAKLHNLVHVAG
jgi:hypothetical protein